jgi:dTDP-4-dehydrorhamnose 3,5-epimerase
MEILTTPIEGVVIVKTTKYNDKRGMFFRAYCQNELAEIIGLRNIVQINISQTHAVGAVRGMHYQRPPQAEMKLIRCIRGKVWDVVVDLRAESTTYLQWHAEELSVLNSKMLVIPEGCAHGFQVFEEDSELLYLHTACYCPEVEGGVRYNDPRINIQWPLTITDISERDLNHTLINNLFEGITL